MVSDLDRYTFDLKGYVTIPGALSASQLEAINAILDEHIAADVSADATTHRFGGCLNWGKPFLDLLDNPTVDAHLQEWISPNYRVDHVYLDIIRSGLSPIGARLHGGATPYLPSMSYNFRNGRIYTDLVVVAYNLHDVNPGEGGFACVPGSHKANYPLPGEVRDMSKGQNPLVEKVIGPAGTAVIFTEALSHGALPWSAAHDRRTLFIKYNHPAVAWSGVYLEADDFPDATERQRQILEAPNARAVNARPPRKADQTR